MTQRQPKTAGDIAALVHGRLIGNASQPVRAPSALNDASPDEVAFVRDERMRSQAAASSAGTLLVPKGAESWDDLSPSARIVVDRPEHAMTTVLCAYAPDELPPDEAIHDTAVVDPTAVIGVGVRLGPRVWIGAHAVVGDGTWIYAGASIYPHVTVGADGRIHAGAVIRERCTLGDRVVLHAGAVIGGEGFGFLPHSEHGGLERVPHIGDVRIASDVEVGAHTCVDRAKFGSTVIGTGCKIDNLVQVAHNVHMGEHCVIAAQTGLAGSSRVGAGSALGAQVGVADHIRIGKGCHVAASSGLMRDVPSGDTVGGTPAFPLRDTMRQVAALQRLPPLIRPLTRLLRAAADEATPKASGNDSDASS